MGLGVYTQPIEARTAQSSKSFLLGLSRLYLSSQRPLTSKCVKWMSLTAGPSRFKFTKFSVASGRALIRLHGCLDSQVHLTKLENTDSAVDPGQFPPLLPVALLPYVTNTNPPVRLSEGKLLFHCQKPLFVCMVSLHSIELLFYHISCALWCQHVKCHWTNCFVYYLINGLGEKFKNGYEKTKSKK